MRIELGLMALENNSDITDNIGVRALALCCAGLLACAGTARAAEVSEEFISAVAATPKPQAYPGLSRIDFSPPNGKLSELSLVVARQLAAVLPPDFHALDEQKRELNLDRARRTFADPLYRLIKEMGANIPAQHIEILQIYGGMHLDKADWQDLLTHNRRTPALTIAEEEQVYERARQRVLQFLNQIPSGWTDRAIHDMAQFMRFGDMGPPADERGAGSGGGNLGAPEQEYGGRSSRQEDLDAWDGSLKRWIGNRISPGAVHPSAPSAGLTNLLTAFHHDYANQQEQRERQQFALKSALPIHSRLLEIQYRLGSILPDLEPMLRQSCYPDSPGERAFLLMWKRAATSLVLAMDASDADRRTRLKALHDQLDLLVGWYSVNLISRVSSISSAAMDKASGNALEIHRLLDAIPAFLGFEALANKITRSPLFLGTSTNPNAEPASSESPYLEFLRLYKQLPDLVREAGDTVFLLSGYQGMLSLENWRRGVKLLERIFDVPAGQLPERLAVTHVYDVLTVLLQGHAQLNDKLVKTFRSAWDNQSHLRIVRTYWAGQILDRLVHPQRTAIPLSESQQRESISSKFDALAYWLMSELDLSPQSDPRSANAAVHSPEMESTARNLYFTFQALLRDARDAALIGFYPGSTDEGQYFRHWQAAAKALLEILKAPPQQLSLVVRAVHDVLSEILRDHEKWVTHNSDPAFPKNRMLHSAARVQAANKHLDKLLGPDFR